MGPVHSNPLRTLGRVVDRIGRFIVIVAICGGLAVALYALMHGLKMRSDAQLSGVTDALKRLLLYPLGAAMAGGVLATVGLVLMYIGRCVRRISPEESDAGG
jgi:hypothetical protein